MIKRPVLNIRRNDYLNYLVLLIFSASIFLITRNFPFYWDNIVQVSIPANWYYEHNFKYFFIPNEFATGHPPLVGMYFAILWKLFGRSLLICHLGMLPFVFGLLMQIIFLLKNIGIYKRPLTLLIFVFTISDATFISQLSLITFEVIQLFFFFLCINLILKRNNKLFAICFLLLTLTSLRGSMIAAGVFCFNILYHFYCTDRSKKINILKYLPGALSLLLFLLFFKMHNGWVIHNTISNQWESSGELASLKGMIINMIIFIWRIIDFGRIGICLFFLLFFIKSSFFMQISDRTIKILLFIIISQFAVFFPILITSQIPFGHRYFLPMLIPMTILTVYWIYSVLRNYRFILATLFAILISGHFWLYPEGISQGWDATTLHWNYFNVSESMHTYIIEQKIDKREIGTFFPNRRSRYFTHIGNDKNDVYEGIPFQNKYLLFSNAFNVNTDVIKKLHSENSQWEPVKQFTKNRIFICLYQKKAGN